MSNKARSYKNDEEKGVPVYGKESFDRPNPQGVDFDDDIMTTVQRPDYQGVTFDTDTDKIYFTKGDNSLHEIENIHKRNALEKLASGLPTVPSRALPMVDLDNPQTNQLYLREMTDRNLRDEVKGFGDHGIKAYKVPQSGEYGLGTAFFDLGNPATNLPYMTVDTDQADKLNLSKEQILLHELSHAMNRTGHTDAGTDTGMNNLHLMNAYMGQGDSPEAFRRNKEDFVKQYKELDDRVGNQYVDQKLFKKLRDKIGYEKDYQTFDETGTTERNKQVLDKTTRLKRTTKK